jgi:predicted transcriptional regulator with HTH domain
MRLLEYAFIYVGAYAGTYSVNYSSENTFINKNFHLPSNGMQEYNRLEPSIDIRRPLIIRTLRRSTVRKKIAEYLLDINLSSSYTSEIAYNVKTTPTNVIGALRGMGSRYKEDESLLSLEIVEEISSGSNK